MAGGLFGGSSNGAVVDVRAFMDSALPERIADIIELGALVSIGRSRDGGAVSLTITHDGAYEREYFRSSEDALDWLKVGLEVLTGLGLTPQVAPPPARQKATRAPRRAP